MEPLLSKEENIEKVESITHYIREIRNIPGKKTSVCCEYAVLLSALLASENQINDSIHLYKFVEKELPDEERKQFIMKYINDGWKVAYDLSKMYTEENLKAAIIQLPKFSKGLEGMYETPESSRKLSARILKGDHEKKADFCCGFGSYLLEDQKWEGDSSYLGIESNEECKEIADIRTSMVNDRIEIRQGSVFALDDGEKFDKIFCDPPFGMKKKESDFEEEKIGNLYKMVPELRKVTTADWLFVFNAVYHLESGGKAVVITPNRMTTSGGINKPIRKRLIDLGFLEAVISLPKNLYGSIPVAMSLFVLSHDNKSVRMIDAGVMTTAGRRYSSLEDRAIEEIISLMDKDADNAVTVSQRELEEGGFSLNPHKYLNRGNEIEKGVPFKSVVKRFTRGTQMNSLKLDNLISKDETEMRFLRLIDIQEGIISENLQSLKKIDEKLEKYCIKNDSLIISKSGLPIKIAVASVKDGQKILANGNLYIIDLDTEKINPYFLKAYFESKVGTDALNQIMAGTNMPNIPLESLKNIEIPLPSKEKQDIIARKYQAKMKEVKLLKNKLEKAKEELKHIYEDTEVSGV